MEQDSFYFSGGCYLQAIEGAHRSLFAYGLAVLTGEQSTGKTLLCNKLRGYLLRKNHRVLAPEETPDSPEILGTFLTRELGLPMSANLPVVLPEMLLGSRADDFNPPILIIDDAHTLSDVTLHELSRLANTRVGELPALRILLSGEPTLVDRLLGRDLFKEIATLLRSHPDCRQELRPLDAEECAELLQDFARKKGLGGSLLASDGSHELYKTSQGYPGALVRLTAQHIALLATTQSQVAEALTQQHAGTGRGTGSQWAALNRLQSKTLLPAALVVVLASLTFLYQQLATPPADSVVQTGEAVSMSSPFVTDAQPRSAPDASQESTEPEMRDGATTAADPQPGADEFALASAAQNEAVNTADSATQAIAAASDEQLNREALMAALTQARNLAAEQLASGEPVSDSGLVLVTASERGVNSDDFALPEYTDLLAEQSSAPRAGTLPAPEPSTVPAVELSVVDQPVADQPVVDQTMVEQAVEVDTTAETSVVEAAVSLATEPQTAAEPALASASASSSLATPSAAPERDQERDQEREPVPEQVSAEQEADSSLAEATEFAQSELSTWEALVSDWVAAWQRQDLPAYFAFYHERFVPRYHASSGAWRDNRERVIGNANGIELRMYDFVLVSEQAEEVEVHFWLDYRSPTYQDQTRKKLVLAPSVQGWTIIEEINLEVRV